jgi:hypothetical protein
MSLLERAIEYAVNVHADQDSNRTAGCKLISDFLWNRYQRADRYLRGQSDEY